MYVYKKARLHSKGDRVVVVVNHHNFQPQLHKQFIYICFVWIIVVVVDGGNNFLNRSSSIKLKKELKRMLSLLIMDFRTRVALLLEAMPIPLEAHRMKFQPLLGSRPASTTHYLRLYRGLIFSFV
jgi:hypothetical protein